MDTISPAKRSWVMSRVKSRDTKPEMLVRSLVHKMGYRFRLRRRDLPGKPDMVLPKCGKWLLKEYYRELIASQRSTIKDLQNKNIEFHTKFVGILEKYNQLQKVHLKLLDRSSSMLDAENIRLQKEINKAQSGSDE